MRLIATTESNQVKLKQLEKVVEKGKRAFIEVGTALREIRDGKLYRGTHKTFELYCEERWEFKRAHAYRLIDAASVEENVSHVRQIANARQASEVAKASPEMQQEVIDRAEAIAEERGKKPTAAIIAEARKEVVAEIVDDEPDESQVDTIDDDADEYEDFDPDVEEEIEAPPGDTSRLSVLRNAVMSLEPHELMLVAEWINDRLNDLGESK